MFNFTNHLPSPSAPCASRRTWLWEIPHFGRLRMLQENSCRGTSSSDLGSSSSASIYTLTEVRHDNRAARA
jgi:hypothetical protein